ncbi:hypothetical protein [Pedobacter steynii]|nr:hypothetical protein [Pedobacter steynii]
MKPNHLFTSMLALTTLVVASCSAPRYAQQSTNEDDVYGSTAKAQIYTPQERPRQQAPQDNYDQSDEYYGTSDPYYDMDYSSRINRFSYSSPWRSYYDPYFDNGYYGYGSGYGYNGFSLGLSFGSLWNSPYYGWGNYYSPFGYNPWGWNNWGWNNYYGGGGYYGGGYYGGGYWGGGYIGGGTYTGRTNNAPRATRGYRDGARSSYGPSGRSSETVRTDFNGNVISRGTRADMYGPNRASGSSRASRGEGSRASTRDNYRPQPSQERQSRGESYRPEPQSRPSYSPPPSRGGSEGGGGGRSSGGGGGGGGRSSRAGRG